MRSLLAPPLSLSLFPSQACLQTHFIDAQWGKYLENISKADCAAALRRVLSAPPQINVKDPGLKCEGESTQLPPKTERSIMRLPAEATCSPSVAAVVLHAHSR